MAAISTLAVNLIARTSAFERGMKRGRMSAQSFRTSISKTIGTVANFAKRLALVAGVGAMGLFLKTTLQSLDAVSKLSRRIGIATDQLLGLRHAAELAGVSNQALDKSLEIFVRRMGEVKSGSGEATRGLEALGLSADRMISLTPEKSLLVIADRIQELGTQAEKSAAAYFLFGRSGAQLLNLFEQGSEGIAKAQKEAEKLGLTLKGFDLTKVEAANDAMLKFKSAIKAVFTEAVIKLAPAIRRLADFMTEYRDRIISTTKKTLVFTAKTFLIVKAIKLVSGAVKVLINLYKFLAARQITVLSLGGPAGWITLAASIGIATGAIIGLNEVIDKTVGGIKSVASESVKLKDTFKQPATFASIDKSIALNKKLIKEAQTQTFLGGADTLGGVVSSHERRIQQLQKQRDILQAQLNISQQQKRIAADLAAAEAQRLKVMSIEKAALGGIGKFVASLKSQIDTFGLSSIEKQLFNLEKIANKLGGEAWLEFNKGLERARTLIDVLTAKQDALKSKEDVSRLPLGQFQQIRSAFVDVAALSGSTRDQKLDKQNTLTEQSNEILRDIRSQNTGSFLL